MIRNHWCRLKSISFFYNSRCVKSNAYNYNYIIIILNYTKHTEQYWNKNKKLGFFRAWLCKILIMQNDEKIVIAIAIINFRTKEKFSSLLGSRRVVSRAFIAKEIEMLLYSVRAISFRATSKKQRTFTRSTSRLLDNLPFSEHRPRRISRRTLVFLVFQDSMPFSFSYITSSFFNNLTNNERIK